jgi:hypothetical protein
MGKQQHLTGISTALQKVCDHAIEIKNEQAIMKVNFGKALEEIRIQLRKEGRNSIRIKCGGFVYEVKAQKHEDDIIIKQVSKGQAADKGTDLPFEEGK